jgi:S-adenosylmethionine:tRNA ribosyltransferase-isomerase
VFATEPGSAEMPSAARGFTAELVTSLVSAGVVFAPLLLHCGVSSPEAGEAPQPERYRVPAATAALVNASRSAGRRVVAVGTTAVRALETVTDETGTVHPGEGWTELVISPARGVRAVDGLITGWHEPEASHLELIAAVAGPEVLERSYAAAHALGSPRCDDGAVGRLLIGGTFLLVFGLLFVIRGILEGNGGQAAVGIPGLLIGIGALISYKLNADQQRGPR